MRRGPFVFAIALGALTAFFGRAEIPLVVWRDLAPHVLVNAVCTWPLSTSVRRLAGLLGDEDAGRRLLRLDPRGRTA